MSHSTDAEIRAALHRKTLRSFHRCNDTLVIAAVQTDAPYVYRCMAFN